MSKNQTMRISEYRVPFKELRAKIEKEKRILVHSIDKEILHILRKEGQPITRGELMDITGIARSTLYDSLTRLTVKGYVTSFSENRTQVGRPKTFFILAGREKGKN